MQLASRARDATVEAILAGALVGVFEGARVSLAAGTGVATLPIVAAVAAAGAIALAMVTRLAVAAIARVPAVAAWSGDLAVGGSSRTRAVWRALVVAAVVLGFGAACFAVVAWAHEKFRFNDAGPVALLTTCALVPLAVGLVALARFVDRRVGARVERVELDGRRYAIVAAAAAIALAVLPAAIVHVTVPALALAAVVTLSLVVVAVLVARGLRTGRSRFAQVAALVAVTATAGGLWTLGGAAPARGAIVSHGVASLRVARTLWSLADSDGDRYAGPSVGGADCDDTNPARHPGALEISGNGVDENCTGADATAGGDRTTARTASAVSPRPNIVLISIDALRADHLGSYGYARKTSPVLDALAATGTRFSWAMTSCPSTRCAIPSMLTGRYASTLRARAETDNVPNLGEVLRAAGYETAAITCCARFALAKRELSGFTTVDASADSVRMQRAGQSNADVVIDLALDWLRIRDASKPYLLWLHLYEPHYPYAAPDGPDFGDDEIDRYDTEIAYVDRHIGRLLEAIDPGAIVAVTADHGDEFNEHGIRFHARSLYNQVVRIPLIVRAPGATTRVVDTPVSLVDVMPTLLDLAGVAGPRGMNGVSLAPALRGQPAPARPVYIELIPDAQIKRDMAAVIADGLKVIWDREANAWSVYRLDDPADTTDRAGELDLAPLQKHLLETLDRETARLPD